jgi:GT2 family glycosyltransferase
VRIALDRTVFRGAAAMSTNDENGPRACPEISVVVPTHGRLQLLERCLRALAAQTIEPARYEVIICDDGSEPALSERHAAALAHPAAVRVLRQLRSGPAAARNRAAAEARGWFLAFTDDDCEPAADWLERLLSHLTEHPGILLGGGIRNGLPDEPCAAATQAIMDFVYEEQERKRRVRLFSTSNLSVPRDGFRAVGGFSLEFREAAGEDYDFCWRWHDAGRPAAHGPDAWVVHRHSTTMRGYLRQHFRYGRGLLHVRRRQRSRSGAAKGNARGAAFAIDLMLSPLRRSPRAWRMALLIALSQAATAMGAAVELLRPADRSGVTDTAVEA